MTVYVVTVNHWDYTEVVGVYSTEVLAKQAIARLGKSDRAGAEITAYEVDAMAGDDE